MMHRPCDFRWTTDDGRLGTNHGCGLDAGHVEPHDCLNCHAEHPLVERAKGPLPLERAVQGAAQRSKDWDHNCTGASCTFTGCESRAIADDLKAGG